MNYAPAAALDSSRRAILFRALPFAGFIAFLALRGATAKPGFLGVGWGALDVRCLYALQVAAALAPMWFWRKHYVELFVLPRSAGIYLTSVATGLAVFLIWIAPLPGWTRVGTPVASFVPLDASGALRWDLIAARILGAACVVPLMEELFWRSFLMRWIDRRDFLALPPQSASMFALMASSTVFAMAHDRWLAGLLAGLAYGLLYRRLGNLWCAVIAHATTNALLAAWVVEQRAWIYW